MRPAAALLVGAAAAAAAGCSLTGAWPPGDPPIMAPAAYLDPALADVRRVLALPLEDEHGPGSGVVSAAVRDELLRLGRFDVVQPAPVDAALHGQDGPKRTGRIEVGRLIELGRRYGVDAALFGAIDRYRPHEPPALGMTLTLIDVDTGRILWQVRDYVDASDQETSSAMRRFFADESAGDRTVFDHDIMSAAPRWFARFAARRAVGSLPPAGG